MNIDIGTFTMEETGGVVFAKYVATNVSRAKYLPQEEKNHVEEANGADRKSILSVNRKILINIPREKYCK